MNSVFPNIFAIIVTYNGMKWYDWCLKGITSSKQLVTPIIVDNCSNDGTVEYLRKLHPECILLPQSKNLGFGQANNKGIEYAIQHGASHILLLNQDATIMPDTLSKLLVYDDGKHILTPIHLNGDGSRLDFLFHERSILGDAMSNGLVEDLLLHKSLKPYYPISFVNAACWLLPTTIINTIGGFNPLFFHYGKDGNYLHRVRYHNFGVRLVPNAYIYHDRVKHGNESAYHSGSLYRKFLSIETNINLSSKERLKQRHKIAIQQFGSALVAHDAFGFVQEWIKAKCKICRQYKAIQNSRTKEKILSPNWINI